MISITCGEKWHRSSHPTKSPQDHKGRDTYDQHFFEAFELGLNQHTIHPRTRAAVAKPRLNAFASVNILEPSKFAHVFSFCSA